MLERKKLKRTGEMTEPCGTPARTFLGLERADLYRTCEWRSERYEEIHRTIVDGREEAEIFDSRRV